MSEKQKVLVEKPIQRIICGDNLILLKEIADNSIDLIYIDPPFFTSKTYEVIWNDGAEIRQFNDRWITSEKDEENPKRSSKNINVYLEFMQPRIQEIYRILKPTGSFYLHCDWHSDSYLRIMCDKIFDRDPLNVITWKRTSKIKGTSNCYSKNADTIYIYTKGNEFYLEVQRTSLSNKQIERDYKSIEKGTNRRFNHGGLILPGESPKELIINGKKYIAPNGKRFRWNQETLDLKLKENTNILYWTKGDFPRYKIYLDEHEGIPITCIWDDIEEISNSSKERLGYPTQKPEALLERIVKASSIEGDIVLDAFCGCGTTIAVCKKLNRQFVGIDVSPTACRLIAKRLNFPINTIEGLPINPNEIAQLDGNEFQNFIIREFGGFSGKRGADGGIDGHLGKLLIQVKKFKAGRMQLDEFSGMLLREKRKEGVFIALEYSKDFRAEVARLKAENGIIIHWFDVQDIIDKKHYELVSKNIPKQGLEKYNGVKPEFKPE